MEPDRSLFRWVRHCFLILLSVPESRATYSRWFIPLDVNFSRNRIDVARVGTLCISRKRQTRTVRRVVKCHANVWRLHLFSSPRRRRRRRRRCRDRVQLRREHGTPKLPLSLGRCTRRPDSVPNKSQGLKESRLRSRFNANRLSPLWPFIFSSLPYRLCHRSLPSHQNPLSLLLSFFSPLRTPGRAVYISPLGWERKIRC